MPQAHCFGAEPIVASGIFFFRMVKAVAADVGTTTLLGISYVTGAVDEQILAVLAFWRYWSRLGRAGPLNCDTVLMGTVFITGAGYACCATSPTSAPTSGLIAFAMARAIARWEHWFSRTLS